MQALQWQEPTVAHMEDPEGNLNPLDMPKCGLKNDFDEVKDENLFHDAGIVYNAVGGRLEDRLLHALNLDGGWVKVKIATFYEKMHVEDSRLGG